MPIVAPTNDDYLCREMSLIEWREKSPRGKEGGFYFEKLRHHSYID